MKSKITYHEQTDMENTLKLREVLKTLPSFTSEFFRGISTTTSTSTRIKYAYDLRIFFQYLQKENPELAKIPMDQMSVDVLDQVTALDLEEYTEYLKAYIGSQESYTTNGEKGLKRKLSALRTFYSYYFKKELIETNPTLLIDMPKLHEKKLSHRCNTCADFDILFQCLGNFISKVDKHFISTFSKHFDAIVFKIDILNI